MPSDESDLSSLLQPLPLEEVIDAFEAAVDSLGLKLAFPSAEGPARVFGSPGTLPSLHVMEAWLRTGSGSVECGVPVLIPEDRLTPVLELCAGLNAQGRVGFSIGLRQTPVAGIRIRLVVGNRPNANALCIAAIESAWEKSDASSTLFRNVVDGADPAEVLAGITQEDDEELFGALPLPTAYADRPHGIEWRGVLDGAEPVIRTDDP
jgi:hypothetical protein